VAESAEEIYRRAAVAANPDGRLPLPPVDDWDTFPFEGDIRVRPFVPPEDAEPPRRGESADECVACTHGNSRAIWSDDRWILVPPDAPSGLPIVLILEPRAHLDFGDLDDELAGELGRLLVRVERAIIRVDGIGRVHIGKWGDGSYHAHVWFLARPARIPQLRSSFAEIWDSILPPTPEPIWRENLAIVARALAEGGGTAHV
jgi:diadenosine tetraphosphate (Ap4A) HIT family hydrolase